MLLGGVGGGALTRWSLSRNRDLQRVKNLASKLHVHSVSYAAELVHT